MPNKQLYYLNIYKRLNPIILDKVKSLNQIFSSTEKKESSAYNLLPRKDLYALFVNVLAKLLF